MNDIEYGAPIGKCYKCGANLYATLGLCLSCENTALRIELQTAHEENGRLKEENAWFQQEIKAGRIYHTCSKCKGTGTSGTMYQCNDCGGKGIKQIALKADGAAKNDPKEKSI